IEHVTYEQAFGPGFEDIRCRVPDLTRVRGVIGYRPRYGLDEIVRAVVEDRRLRLGAGERRAWMGGPGPPRGLSLPPAAAPRAGRRPPPLTVSGRPAPPIRMTNMRRTLLRGLALLALGLAVLALRPYARAADTPFKGVWKLTVTDRGSDIALLLLRVEGDAAA